MKIGATLFMKNKYVFSPKNIRNYKVEESVLNLFCNVKTKSRNIYIYV